MMSLGKQSYPTEIIPSPDFVLSMDVDALLAEYPGLMVVRLQKGEENQYKTISESGEWVWNSGFLGCTIANLSVNLAGGLFDVRSEKHLKFLPVAGEASQRWCGGVVQPSLYENEDNFTVSEPCFGVCFRLKDIHKRVFPYYKKFNSAEERDSYASEADKLKNDDKKQLAMQLVGKFEEGENRARLEAYVRVNHAPTNLNYWHMTLDTYVPHSKDFVPPEEKVKKAEKRLFASIRQHLRLICQTNLTPEYTIAPCYYYK